MPANEKELQKWIENVKIIKQAIQISKKRLKGESSEFLFGIPRGLIFSWGWSNKKSPKEAPKFQLYAYLETQKTKKGKACKKLSLGYYGLNELKNLMPQLLKLENSEILYKILDVYEKQSSDNGPRARKGRKTVIVNGAA